MLGLFAACGCLFLLAGSVQATLRVYEVVERYQRRAAEKGNHRFRAPQSQLAATVRDAGPIRRETRLLIDLVTDLFALLGWT